MNLREHALAGQARWRLAEDERISGLPIDVHVQDGDVHVLGMVESDKQRKTIELLLNGICGVQQIVMDRLLIRER